MSTEKSHDPFAAIHNRYGLVQAAQSLPQRLTTTEIAQLAYPDDTADNDRFQLVIQLGKAIERGELEACGTATPPAYLTTQGVKYGPRQPLIAREAFARFLTAMGTVPSGRLAEWISPPDEPEQPPISARLAEKTASQQAQSQERPQAGPGAPRKHAEAYPFIEFAPAAQAARSPAPRTGRPSEYDDLVQEVEQEIIIRTQAANGKRPTNAECIRAVVHRHIPMPDHTADAGERNKAKVDRERLIGALAHCMKPSSNYQSRRRRPIT